MKIRTIAGLSMAIVGLSGCYSYRLRPVEQVPDGADVRARVSAEEAGRLSDLIGGELGRTLTGRFVEWNGGSALFEVRQPGTNERLFQRVDVPRSDVVEMEVREFDRVKTALVAVPLAGLMSWLIADQFSGDATKEGGEDPPIDNQIRIPLIRIGW